MVVVVVAVVVVDDVVAFRNAGYVPLGGAVTADTAVLP